MDEHGIYITGSSLYHPSYPHVDTLSVTLRGGTLSDEQERILREWGGHLLIRALTSSLRGARAEDETVELFVEVGSRAQLDARLNVG